ncbi:hypothetical protein SY2F82_73920 [Streptomyces sp. Y2F8-2]|nr:hypothetical protein SY2F82_73920 [Streptomyces sp. Y2F8-2]
MTAHVAGESCGKCCGRRPVRLSKILRRQQQREARAQNPSLVFLVGFGAGGRDVRAGPVRYPLSHACRAVVPQQAGKSARAVSGMWASWR